MLIACLLLLFMLLTMTASLSASLDSAHHQTKKRWLVVDFDGTITANDTTGLLPRVAAKLSSGNVEERVEQFEVFVEEYFRLYNAAKENMCHESMSLEQALASLDNVSDRVTAQVSESGVLSGLGVAPEDIEKLLENECELRDHTRLQPGCLEVLARQIANDWHLGVLSINWCPSLIHAAVVSPLQSRCEPETNVNVPIWSNNVNSEGVVSLQVSGALAKRKRIAKLQQEGSFVAYVGDSSTDLLALIEADLGILIGDCQSAASTAERWDVKVLPLSQRRDAHRVDECDILWMAESWSEIDQALKAISI
jgi:2-hydroxy-3-keto-5-methylthiopentenyl-1-phosphate phosphatase